MGNNYSKFLLLGLSAVVVFFSSMELGFLSLGFFWTLFIWTFGLSVAMLYIKEVMKEVGAEK